MRLRRAAVRWLLAVVTMAGMMAPTGARAEAAPVEPDAATARAKALFQHAETLYTLERYAEALDEYQRAFELKPLPGFLYNIAQCHRQLGHHDKAAHFYRRYLDRSPHAPNRERVIAFIDEMDRKAAEERVRAAAAAKAEPPAPAVPSGAPGAPSVAVDHGPGSPTPLGALPRGALGPSPGRPADTARPLYRRWWVWSIVGGVVAAGAVAGIATAATRGGGATPQGTLGPSIDVH